MVSKITIFEAHLDGAQFGPASPGQDGKGQDDSSRGDEATETSDGHSRVRIVLFGGILVVTLLAIAIAIRRIRSDGESDESEPSRYTGKEHVGEEDRTEERTVGAIE